MTIEEFAKWSREMLEKAGYRVSGFSYVDFERGIAGTFSYETVLGTLGHAQAEMTYRSDGSIWANYDLRIRLNAMSISLVEQG